MTANTMPKTTASPICPRASVEISVGTSSCHPRVRRGSGRAAKARGEGVGREGRGGEGRGGGGRRSTHRRHEGDKPGATEHGRWQGGFAAAAASAPPAHHARRPAACCYLRRRGRRRRQAGGGRVGGRGGGVGCCGSGGGWLLRHLQRLLPPKALGIGCADACVREECFGIAGWMDGGVWGEGIKEETGKGGRHEGRGGKAKDRLLWLV